LIHLRELKEIADVVSRLLFFSSFKYRDDGEKFLITRKSKHHTHLQDNQERGPEELQAAQPHLTYLEGYSDNPHTNDYRVTGSN